MRELLSSCFDIHKTTAASQNKTKGKPGLWPTTNTESISSAFLFESREKENREIKGIENLDGIESRQITNRKKERERQT